MPTQPGGVGSLHANRSAAGRSNPTQAEFSGATTTKRQKTAVCFGHIAMEQESRRRTCAARRMAGPVIFPVSRKVSTRVGVRPGFFSERRRPLAAAQASCDWLQPELHDGHPRETVGGARATPSRTAPTTTSPEEIAPRASSLHPTALPRGIAATAPTPSNRNSFEYEPYILPTEDFYN